RGLRRGVDRPFALRRIEHLAGRGDGPGGDAGGDIDRAIGECAERFNEAPLGVAERLTLRQALTDRANDFAAGEFAVIGEVARVHASQVDALDPALLKDRTVRLLAGIEGAEARRI